MIIMKKLRKSFVFIMIVALLLGQTTFTYAASPTDAEEGIMPLSIDTSKPTIYVDYLGNAAVSADRGPQEKQACPGFTQSNIGDVFWVGVRLDNLNQVDFLKNDGLRDLEIAFDYNPKYVVPCDNLAGSTNENVDKTAWMKIIDDFNFSEDGSDDKWNKTYYELADYSACEASPDVTEGREYAAPSGWKTQFVSITKKTTDKTSNRFYGVDDANGHYILKIPFQLKDAPTDGGKPLIFRLALGPSSLVMTTGDNGSVSYQWEKNNRSQEVLNLKNTFQFVGDLNVFKSDSEFDEMTDFTASYQTEESTPEALDYETAQFYSGEEQTAEQATKFLPTTTTYYITVPSYATEVKLDMSNLKDAPTVKRWDYGATPSDTNTDTVTAAEDSKLAGNWSATVPLKGAGTTYRDTISITINDGAETPTVYLVHVQKSGEASGEAKIVLHPGNSPYGLIMRDDTTWKSLDAYKNDTQIDEETGLPVGRKNWIADAKDSFNNGNKFVDGDYKPVDADTKPTYWPHAWVGDSVVGKDDDIANPNINMDRNDTAQFLFNRTDFVDAGYTAYKADGSVDTEPDMAITVEVDRMTASADSMMAMKDTDVSSTKVNISDGEKIFTDSTTGKAYSVRPGVYKITYTYTDSSSGKTAEPVTRYLVVVWENGDVDMSRQFNDTDAIESRNVFSGRKNPQTGVTDLNFYLYRYRIADVDNSHSFNDTDAIESRNYFSGRKTKVTYYTNIQ